MIIFATQQEVHEKDGNGSASDDHDAVAQEEEAEHIVHFSKPHVVHDEIEFHEDGAKGEDADQ